MKLAPILGLAATAGEDDAVRAVGVAARAPARLTEGQRDEHAGQMLALAAQLAGFERAMSKAAEETFIEGASRTGKIITGSNFETSSGPTGRDPEGARRCSRARRWSRRWASRRSAAPSRRPPAWAPAPGARVARRRRPHHQVQRRRQPRRRRPRSSRRWGSRDPRR